VTGLRKSLSKLLLEYVFGSAREGIVTGCDVWGMVRVNWTIVESTQSVEDGNGDIGWERNIQQK
jgi:hypothetical protein